MNCFRKFKKRNKANTAKSEPPFLNYDGSIVSANMQQNLRVFSPAELRKATKNFINSSRIGEGGNSNVFKGAIKLHHGTGNATLVAIKRLEQGSDPHWGLALMERPEVYLLGGVDHPNLVKLLGYCSVDARKGHHKFLVYEYMPNGSFRSSPLQQPFASSLLEHPIADNVRSSSRFSLST